MFPENNNFSGRGNLIFKMNKTFINFRSSTNDLQMARYVINYSDIINKRLEIN